MCILAKSDPAPGKLAAKENSFFLSFIYFCLLKILAFPAEVPLKNNGEAFMIQKVYVKISFGRKILGEDEKEHDNARSMVKAGWDFGEQQVMPT